MGKIIFKKDFFWRSNFININFLWVLLEMLQEKTLLKKGMQTYIYNI